MIRPAVAGFVVVAALAGCTAADDRPRDRAGTGIQNRGLRLEVEVRPNLVSYRVQSTFTYEVSGQPAEAPYFVFPGVDSAAELDLRLDGETIDIPRLAVEPHPLYSEEVFRLPAGSRAVAEGKHRLTVAGPWLASDAPYFARWSGWHPYLGDRAHPVPIELEVTVPASLRVVASGRREGESVVGAARISRWRTRNPQGWTFLAVGDYSEEALVQDGTPFLLWLPEGEQELDASSLVEEPHRVLSYLEAKLGTAGIDTVGFVFFPGEKLTNFSIDGLLVGSSATAARVSDSPEYLRGFLAHELAHYWFGDLLQSHGRGARWLSEGFAEYWRYRYEESVGADPLSWALRNQLMLRRFAAEPMPTLMEEAPGESEALFYQKGSFVLYMLERTVGRETLDAAMRKFVERYRGRSVEPSDFFSVASESADEDLGWFARQWLERPRGPELSIPEARARRERSGYRVEAEIAQQEPAYRLELPIVIRTEDGLDHRLVRPVDKARHRFSFQLDAQPERITLDPEGVIFKWFPPASLPVDFAGFRSSLAEAGRYYVEGPGGEDATGAEWSRVRRWVEEQFGAERTATDRENATHLILLGARATVARRSIDADLPGPAAATLQAFVRRDPEDSARLLVGIEGSVPESMPPIIPEAPLSFVVFRGGGMAAAHAVGPPRVSRDFEVE